MGDDYDVIVLGGGPAGENAADRAAQGGLRVALVEAELVGGECSYWACIPSKALLRAGTVVAAARRVPGAKEAVNGVIDADKVLAWRNYMVSDWHDDGQVEWARSAGIVIVRGRGRLDGERRVTVTPPDGPDRTLTATKAVVIATGSVPANPPIPGLAESRPWGSREATSGKEVPRRLAVIGGGVVACEMAQAWRWLGAEVTMLIRGNALLERNEPFAGELVVASFAEAGIDVGFGAAPTEVRRAGDDGPVTLTLPNGGTLVVDEVLVATGRRPNTRNIGLDTVGLPEDKAITVDGQLRVTGAATGDGSRASDWLYAIGDVNGRSLLTHMGKYQGRLVGDLIAGRGDPAATAFADDMATPGVVFTDPQVGSVGHTEASARQAGIDVGIADADMGAVPGVYLSGDGITGRARLVIDKERNVIVGATFVGPEIADLVQGATVAIVGQVPLERLWHAVPSFPSVSEIWLKLLQAYGL